MSGLCLEGAGARLTALAERVWLVSGLGGEVNVIVTDSARLAALNSEFRGREGPTDVLTFPLGGEPVLGEIYIAADLCPPGEDAELWVLDRIIHGLLHLTGCHHATPAEEAANEERHARWRAAALAAPP